MANPNRPITGLEKNMKKYLGFIFLALLLTGCGGESPATEEMAAATAGEDPVAEAAPTTSPTEAPVGTPFDKYALPMGQTAEGAFFIGREDAPVTMIDYSNFL